MKEPLLKNTLDVFQSKTRKTLLWMNLSHEPFVVLYTLLPFIIRKDLNASLLQISLLATLRPVLPLFSFYWSARLTNQTHRLRANLIGAWVLGRIPFLLIPWLHNVWYIIFCCAVYELFNKSGIPALIEILKLNLPKESREKTYTFYFVLSFIESILLGLFIGNILDFHTRAWQFLCCFTALLGLSSLFLQLQLPIPAKPSAHLPHPSPLVDRIILPWKDAFTLLKTRTDFAQFQYGFMLGGFGLMLIAPSLSIFYADQLLLDHSQVTTGRSILMGIGIVGSSLFWQKLFNQRSISELTSYILIGFALFPLVLILSQFHMSWFYLSFLLYGIAQAGSHLLWNLSGTFFATQEDSSPFSRVNILMLGIRGIIAPALGGLLCQLLGPPPVLALGSLFCLIGTVYMIKTQRNKFKNS
jgi:predicted MFS family arabinose efflux permease